MEEGTRGLSEMPILSPLASWVWVLSLRLTIKCKFLIAETFLHTPNILWNLLLKLICAWEIRNPLSMRSWKCSLWMIIIIIVPSSHLLFLFPLIFSLLLLKILPFLEINHIDDPVNLNKFSKTLVLMVVVPDLGHLFHSLCIIEEVVILLYFYVFKLNLGFLQEHLAFFGQSMVFYNSLIYFF